MAQRAGRLAAAVVAALWFTSAITWQVKQASDVLDPAPTPLPSHPEIPGTAPGRWLAILDACARTVGPGDKLVILGRPTNDIVDVFVYYRLAYLLYPAPVVGLETAEQARLADSELFAETGATWLLVLGSVPPELAGAMRVARPAPDATLVRLMPPNPGS